MRILIVGGGTIGSAVAAALRGRDDVAGASLVNAAIEGFGRAAAVEAPREIGVNVVSPPWIAETLQKMGRPPGGIPAAVVAQSYVRSVDGSETGQVYDPKG